MSDRYLHGSTRLDSISSDGSTNVEIGTIISGATSGSTALQPNSPALTAMGSDNLSVATKQYVDAKVNKAGDTMTGDLYVPEKSTKLVAGQKYHLHVPAGTTYSGGDWVICDSITNIVTSITPITQATGETRPCFGSSVSMTSGFNLRIGQNDIEYPLTNQSSDFDCDFIYSASQNDPVAPGTLLQYISGQVATEAQVSKKQDTLVSGTNIKTINNNSLLGSGDITIGGGGGTKFYLHYIQENVSTFSIMWVISTKSTPYTLSDWINTYFDQTSMWVWTGYSPLILRFFLNGANYQAETLEQTDQYSYRAKAIGSTSYTTLSFDSASVFSDTVTEL